MPLLRTILRRLFFTAAAGSTLLLLPTLILWPVSYYRQLYAYHDSAGGDRYDLESDSGRAVVVYDSGFALPPGWHFGADPPEWSHWSYRSWNTPDPDFPPAFTAPTFLGVCWFHPPTGAGLTYHVVLVPFSYLALLFSILPLLAFRSIRRRRRAQRVGLCPKCGYDLRVQRAQAGGARCPECGTPVGSHR